MQTEVSIMNCQLRLMNEGKEWLTDHLAQAGQRRARQSDWYRKKAAKATDKGQLQRQSSNACTEWRRGRDHLKLSLLKADTVGASYVDWC